ncbi:MULTISPECIES: HD domain-containing protein [Gemmiger]|uniref:HD domain-containing protein n=1 Tax=Gemmiger TaxID=204475 RepID=UPI00195D75D7|nr:MULTISPECIES: HD domain-containing protein [Gemmiger]HIX34418.1 HD domain-containing protein [Candidatus Gemmiger avium]
MLPVTYEMVRHSEEINTYIRQADASLVALGYTEHSFAHVTRCAETASGLLQQLGADERQVELARIAGYMHDIGNLVNRVDHAQSGAVMAFRILDKMGMPPEDTALVVTAIGNHDESTAFPVNGVAAALILADKTDVRRSRVRNRDTIRFDIHDRVNWAVEHSQLDLDKAAGTVTLVIRLDTQVCSVMDYFEIFLARMLLCRKAAEYFGLTFRLEVNGQQLV